MLARNREVRRTLVICLVITLVGTSVAYLATRSAALEALGGAYVAATSADGASAASNTMPTEAGAAEVALRSAACTLIIGLTVTAAFMMLTLKRYRALSNMAAKLDRVLAGGRDIRLRDMGEGELAILSSEIDKVIARLNLTVDELQAEKLALSDALADISHQLKTPLTSIAISTELIRDRLAARGDSEDMVEKLRLIQALQARVEDLVAALLKLARIDAGVIKLVRANVDVAELVRRSIEPLAIAFDIADVALDVDVQAGAAYEGDLTWSVEALENVLKNCMEHTPSGGRVRVRATEDILACRIRVEDTGPGISQADLPHIFERFYRGSHGAEGASSEVSPTGVGIGLSLSKSLVTAQGGTLTAENLHAEDGSVIGAAFTLVFFKTVV